MPKKIKNLLWYALFIAVIYLATYHGALYFLQVRADRAAPPQAYLYHFVYKEPYIDGPPEFQTDIKNALATIKEVSPEQYADISKYCVRIKLVNLSTKISAIANNRNVYVFKSRYDKSSDNIYFLERILVHETTHFIQQDLRLVDVPIEKSEAEALAAERQLLTALKVPPEDIEQIAGDQLLKLKWWEENKQVRSAMGRN